MSPLAWWLYQDEQGTCGLSRSLGSGDSFPGARARSSIETGCRLASESPGQGPADPAPCHPVHSDGTHVRYHGLPWTFHPGDDCN